MQDKGSGDIKIGYSGFVTPQPIHKNKLINIARAHNCLVTIIEPDATILNHMEISFLLLLTLYVHSLEQRSTEHLPQNR